MKESLLTDIFWHAGFFLALSALIIPLLRYFKIPAALGYLFAGIAIGPFALGALEVQYPLLESVMLTDISNVKILAELGIVLLLFVVGLELTPSRLWQMRHLVFGLGGLQVLVTSSVIGLIAYLWGNTLQVAVLLGLGLALSSTAMVVQWLQEQKLFASNVGRSSFSILLLQDLAVIPILLLLTILSADIGDNVVEFVSWSLLKMVATAAAIFIVGKITLKPLFLFANKHGGAEVFMALSLFIIIVSASIADFAGLSMALGAFIAGLLLADTQYRHEISSLIIPFKSMLIGIFFFSFGMSIDLSFIMEKPLWLMLSVVGLMSIKAIIIFVLCKLWKQTTAVSAESALLLSQAGEFGLLVVGGALTVGLMTQSIGQFMLLTVGLTMMIAPLMAPISRRIGHLIESQSHEGQSYHADKAEKVSDQIVILGYGRVGQEIGNILSQEGYSILGFDKNLDTVNEARAECTPVYLGDVSRQSTLKAAYLEDALSVLITLDDPKATKRTIQAIRKINQTIPIVVRTHSADAEELFNDFTNIDAIAENKLVSEKLVEKVLNQCRTGHAAEKPSTT